MSELADVLSGAESRTEAALPGFDTAVLARAVSTRVRRGRALRATRTGVVALAVIGAIGVGGAYGLAALRDNTPAVPGPAVSPSISAAPSPDPEISEGAAVTVGEGLPSAAPLTEEVLASVGSGWVLALFDSTFRPGVDEPIQGQRVLYLVSPQGERYEVTNLTRYSSLYLAGWDTERNVALLVDARSTIVTIGFGAGGLIHEWQFCGEGGSLSARPLGDGEWLLRGFCSGAALDGRYADDGRLLGSEGIVPGGEGITVMDAGDTQVRYEFEMPPAESYVAYREDGTSVPLEPVGPTTACYPLGPSLIGGLAVQCWGEGDAVSIWNLDLEGGAPSPIAVPETLGAIEAASGGALPAGGAALTDYCLAGDHEALVTSHPAVAALGEDGPTILGDGEYRATSCLGGVGDTILVAGQGPLWTWNARTGAVVTLLPVPEPGDDGVWVGASEGGAIIHP
jgi:hypothetical protein